MKLFDHLIFLFCFFYFSFVSAASETNVSNLLFNSTLRFLECNTYILPQICDPDQIFTDSERKDLEKELQKLESRTRESIEWLSFVGDGITGEIIIAKTLIDGANGTETMVAQEILENWKRNNAKGFVIVFSTETNKFWAIKQRYVHITIDEFVEVFDSQKLHFEKKNYKQAFTNIINGLGDKAVLKMKKQSTTTLSPLFNHYSSSRGWNKQNNFDMFSSAKMSSTTSAPDNRSRKSSRINADIFFIIVIICLIFSSFAVCLGMQYKKLRTNQANVQDCGQRVNNVESVGTSALTCSANNSQNTCPPPSYSEAIRYTCNREAISGDDKFWDGFVAASRIICMIQSDVSNRTGYIPGVQNIGTNVYPSAPISDENE